MGQCGRAVKPVIVTKISNRADRLYYLVQGLWISNNIMSTSSATSVYFVVPEIAPPAEANPDDISSGPDTQHKATSYPQREPIYNSDNASQSA
jgi:hypothetical protein